MLKNYFNNNFFQDVLDGIFSSITLFGNPVFYILVILVLVAFKVPLALDLFLALLCIELLCVFIKLIYHKERPVPQSRQGLYNKIDANSFPSVHSARISFLAAALGLYYNNVPLFIIGAIVMLGVGYSRIYLKRHDVKDVLGGFLIGAITALIIFYIIR